MSDSLTLERDCSHPLWPTAPPRGISLFSFPFIFFLTRITHKLLLHNPPHFLFPQFNSPPTYMFPPPSSYSLTKDQRKKRHFSLLFQQYLPRYQPSRVFPPKPTLEIDLTHLAAYPRVVIAMRISARPPPPPPTTNPRPPSQGRNTHTNTPGPSPSKSRRRTPSPLPDLDAAERPVRIGYRPVGGRAAAWTIGVVHSLLLFLENTKNKMKKTKKNNNNKADDDASANLITASGGVLEVGRLPDPHYHWCVLVGGYHHQMQITDGVIWYDREETSWSEYTISSSIYLAFSPSFFFLIFPSPDS